MKIHAFVSTILCCLIFSYTNAQQEHIINSRFMVKLDSLLKKHDVPTVAMGLIKNNQIVMTEVFGLGESVNDASSPASF